MTHGSSCSASAKVSSSLGDPLTTISLPVPASMADQPILAAQWNERDATEVHGRALVCVVHV